MLKICLRGELRGLYFVKGGSNWGRWEKMVIFYGDIIEVLKKEIRGIVILCILIWSIFKSWDLKFLYFFSKLFLVGGFFWFENRSSRRV